MLGKVVCAARDWGRLVYPEKQSSSFVKSLLFLHSFLPKRAVLELHYLKCEISLPLMGYSVWELLSLYLSLYGDINLVKVKTRHLSLSLPNFS